MPDLPEEAVQAAAEALKAIDDAPDAHPTLADFQRHVAEVALEAAAPVLAAHARQDDALLAEVDRLREQVAELQEDAAFLNALQIAGVDNWDGYSYACEIARGEADD